MNKATLERIMNPGVLLTQQAHAGAAGVRLLVYVYRSRCACYGVVVGGKDIFLRQSGAASPPA